MIAPASTTPIFNTNPNCKTLIGPKMFILLATDSGTRLAFTRKCPMLTHWNANASVLNPSNHTSFRLVISDLILFGSVSIYQASLHNP